MRLGIADHLGWAVAVTVGADHRVVDRRRIELVEDGEEPMPVHHGIDGLDDADAAALVALVARVRASAVAATAAALAEIEDDAGPIESIHLRTLPDDFPTDIATVRLVPWEARADAVMYREVLAEQAASRGWCVEHYDAKTVEQQAIDLLGPRADDVLRGPRTRLGAPWQQDHRVAVAATIVDGGSE